MNKMEWMIKTIREKYHLDAPEVFSAMLQVPREKFVSKKNSKFAYNDQPVDIGYGQTVSQPYTVAFMTDLLQIKGDEKVLEIGTGSGYQTAVLSLLVKEVYSIEVVPGLAEEARERLEKLGYKNVQVRTGQGAKGWPEQAPFDAMIITAGVEKVPKKLFEQLGIDGVLLAPVGRQDDKIMTKYKKTRKHGKNIIKKKEYGAFNFVPFVE